MSTPPEPQVGQWVTYQTVEADGLHRRPARVTGVHTGAFPRQYPLVALAVWHKPTEFEQGVWHVAVGVDHDNGQPHHNSWAAPPVTVPTEQLRPLGHGDAVLYTPLKDAELMASVLGVYSPSYPATLDLVYYGGPERTQLPGGLVPTFAAASFDVGGRPHSWRFLPMWKALT